MPGMSGPELVDRVGPDIPVVFVSGYAADHLPDLRLGPRRVFVAKPFSSLELLTAVGQLLGAAEQ